MLVNKNLHYKTPFTYCDDLQDAFFLAYLVSSSQHVDMCLFSCHYHNKVVRKVTLSLGLLSLPIRSFSGIHKVRKFWLNLSQKILNSAFNAQASRVNVVVVKKNLSQKFWNLAFNAQASRVNIVVVQARENICSSSGGAQEKGKTVYYQNYSFLSSNPLWMLVYFFAGFFESHPCMAKLRILVLCFPYFTDNFNTSNLSDACSSLGCSKVSILLTLFNVISHFKNGKWNECFCMHWKQHMKLYFLY
jgi:hypothetical protein